MPPPPFETPRRDRRADVARWVTELQVGIDPEECSRQIFSCYYRWVRDFFRRRRFSPQDAEDLAQETFLRVWSEIGSFRGDSPFESWLFAVAANVLRNELRRRGRDKRRAPEVALDAATDGAPFELPSPDASPEQAAFALQRSAALDRAIEELPPQMAQCLALRLEQGLKYREIAVLLKISIETVKSHLFQARQRLRDALGEPYRELKGP